MTTNTIDTDELQVRLDWMRAEFRAAQQRRYESRRPAPVKDVTVTVPSSVPQAQLPILSGWPDAD